jgi:hypothetical protein
MTKAARLARSMNLKIKGVVHLEQQIRGYELLHQNEHRQISELQAELANRYILPNLLQTPADQIWADLFETARFIQPSGDIHLNPSHGRARFTTSQRQHIKCSRESALFRATVYCDPSFRMKNRESRRQCLI